jgi:DNA-binding NarL/FixJ family response regulator
VTVRVLLVDDHEVVRRGIYDLIEGEDDLVVVGEAATVEEALAVLPTCDPDVAVLDVRLPDGNGVELCRELKSRSPKLAALMLTSFDDDEALFSAVMAGAAGHVLKQIRGTDLVDAIKRVGKGESLLDPALSRMAFERLKQAPLPERAGPLPVTLTPQERKILDLIAAGQTNREIAQHMSLAEKTVKNYVSNLLHKLGMRRRTEAAVYAATMAGRPPGYPGSSGRRDRTGCRDVNSDGGRPR